MVRVQKNLNYQEQLRIDNQAKDILETIKGKLTAPMCLSPKEFYWDLGNRCLIDWEKLPFYSQNEPTLKELKEKLEKIKNNELANYNREMAKNICDYLVKK